MINIDLKDVVEFTCFPTYIILSAFLPVIQESSVLVIKPGFYEEVDLLGQPLSWRAMFNQDKIVLLELLPEYYLLNKIRNDIPVQDELSRGLREMMCTKKIPI
jgi:hypothetical protein